METLPRCRKGLRSFLKDLLNKQIPPSIDCESVIIDWELPLNLSSAISNILIAQSSSKENRIIALRTAKSHLEKHRYELSHNPHNEKCESSSMIDHPDHYAKGRKYEPIEVIEDWNLGFHTGNALKYISRIGRKDDAILDIDKSIWYLDREILNCSK